MVISTLVVPTLVVTTVESPQLRPPGQRSLHHHCAHALDHNGQDHQSGDRCTTMVICEHLQYGSLQLGGLDHGGLNHGGLDAKAGSSPGQLWVAGQRCLGGVMLLDSPHSSVLALEVFCNTVICGFALALCWRQQLQGTFAPQDTAWEAFAPVLANEHQLSQQPPGRCRERLGRGVGGLGAVGTARAGDASPSIELSDGEGCKGAGGVPAALTLSKGFPWEVDVKPPAPCKGSHPCWPPRLWPLVCTFLAPSLALLHETLGKA